MDVAVRMLQNLDTRDLYLMGFIVVVIVVGFALTDWGLE